MAKKKALFDNMFYTEKVCKELFNLLASGTDINAAFTQNIHTIDLINKALFMFKWNNLPNTITKRSVEPRLFFRGKLCFFFDDEVGYQILPFTYINGVNDENQYTQLKPLSITGRDYGVKIINQDAVVIRDNELEIPPIIYAMYYGDKIAELFTIRDKNNNWLNLPIIFKASGDRETDKRRALEAKQIFIDGKTEVAYMTDLFGALEMFDVKPQYFGAELEEQIKVMKNNFLEYLGIDHLNFDKKERMITTEVETKNEENSLNRDKRLEPRKQACELINEIWGLNVSVEFNEQDPYDTGAEQIVSSAQ